MNRIVLITSTGRTGTMFFRDYLTETCPGALCLHEPKPSRIFKFYSNMLLAGRISPMIPSRKFQRTRNRLAAGAGTYIESNNFVFGCIPAIRTVIPEMSVIHVVRHPVSYARSHIGHGFWTGHKKLVARFVPFWLEDLKVQKNDPVRLLLLRWDYVNRKIRDLSVDLPYLPVRFEDLFSKDRSKGAEVLNSIRNFIGYDPMAVEDNISWLERPKNVSRQSKGDPRIFEAYGNLIRTGLSETMESFGYSVE